MKTATAGDMLGIHTGEFQDPPVSPGGLVQ
jgi:hypothetical protein